MEVKPIGYINSLFAFKNGTPRQPSVCPFARGSLKIEKSIFTNPEHSLEGLEEFSHVWVIFVFHKNTTEYVKAKVKPPRLNGKRVGLFSTRSPYRPNAIGLTLAKLENISGGTLHLSGIDLLDGTPVLDIKPYIHKYDSPISCPSCMNSSPEEDVKVASDSINRGNQEPELLVSDMEQVKERNMSSTDRTTFEEPKSQMSNSGTESKSEENDPSDNYDYKVSCDHQSLNIESSSEVVNKQPIVKAANWISDAPISKLSVKITDRASFQLQKFSKTAENPDFKLKFLHSSDEALDAIKAILCEDPRSIYRRQKCEDSLYYFTVDTLHVTCWFDDNIVEIVRIQPILYAQHLKVS